MNKVTVVTRPDLGWDCVVAVLAGVPIQDILDRFPSSEFVLTEVEVETSLDEYLDTLF